MIVWHIGSRHSIFWMKRSECWCGQDNLSLGKVPICIQVRHKARRRELLGRIRQWARRIGGDETFLDLDLQKRMRRVMDRNRQRLAILAQIVVGAEWVHTLCPRSVHVFHYNIHGIPCISFRGLVGDIRCRQHYAQHCRAASHVAERTCETNSFRSRRMHIHGENQCQQP